MRKDPESSKPVLEKVRGSRLIYIKEAAAGPVCGDTLKNILDPRDAGVTARHNCNKKGESTEFPVTWSILSVGQSPVHLRPGEADTGGGGKISELNTHREFVAAPDVHNPRHAQADQGLANDVLRGAMDAELLFWTQGPYQTLLPDVCKSRSILPKPAIVKVAEAEHKSDTVVDQLMRWICRNLEVATVETATPYTEIMAAAWQIPGVDEHVLTAAGLGLPARHKHGKRHEVERYVAMVACASGTAPVLVRLRG